MVSTERVFSCSPTILNAINNLLVFVIGTFEWLWLPLLSFSLSEVFSDKMR